MGPKDPYTAKVSTAALLSYNQNILTVLALSFILFMFLALYRPGLRDWSTVNGTQTGISKYSLLRSRASAVAITGCL